MSEAQTWERDLPKAPQLVTDKDWNSGIYAQLAVVSGRSVNTPAPSRLTGS